MYNIFSFKSKKEKTKNYFQLLKPRTMLLILFTATISMIIAPGTLNFYLKIICLIAIAMGSGSARCLNMWYERFLDILMVRTKKRPLPKSLIQSKNALVFGCVLSAVSILILAIASNIESALLLLLSIFIYVVLYTMILKPRTSQHIVIGGISGALSPVIAWQAVAPGFYLMPWLLFLIIFFWIPPNFWILSLMHTDDYKKAKIPILPNTHGIKTTKKYILFYTFLTALSSLTPVYFNFLGSFYLISSCCLGSLFIVLASKFYKNKIQPINFFYFTFLYLIILLLSIAVDNFIS